MNPVIDTLWNYLIGGQFFEFYTYFMNTYFPFGLFFWMVGFILFSVLQIKYENMAFAGAVAAIYFVIVSEIPGMVTYSYSKLGMQWFGFVLALVTGYYLYKTIKG